MPGMDGFAVAERIKKNPKLTGATIMMLTSAGHLGDAARCRELGIAAYLIKPIRQLELLDAMCKALGSVPAKQPAAAVDQDRSLSERRPALRILLAEDNAVNQTLAVRLLEKRGHCVKTAENGRDALAAFSREEFDLVLMDVQMPGMNGFEATAAIRAQERATGAHVPIVAMTAHALKGDEERCLAAGMDAYVSKPIKANVLFQTIEGLLPDAVLQGAGAARDARGSHRGPAV